MKTYTIPVGSYWLGDPIFFLSKDEWHWFAEHAAQFDNFSAMYAKLPDGRLAFAMETAFGEGVYKLPDGRELVSDSGYLGLVSMSDTADATAHGNTLGIWQEVGADFFCSRTTKGLLKFGDIEIQTGFGSDAEWDKHEEAMS